MGMAEKWQEHGGVAGMAGMRVAVKQI